MAKTRSMYVCQNCGAESVRWIGRCPSCSEWNTYVEERISKDTSRPGLVDVTRNATKGILNVAKQLPTVGTVLGVLIIVTAVVGLVSIFQYFGGGGRTMY